MMYKRSEYKQLRALNGDGFTVICVNTASGQNASGCRGAPSDYTVIASPSNATALQ